MNLLNSLIKWLASQLDKLKIKNPIVFFVTQGLLITVNGLFINDTININTPSFVEKLLGLVGLDSIDTLVILLLSGLIAAIGPRTTALKNGTV